MHSEQKLRPWCSRRSFLFALGGFGAAAAGIALVKGRGAANSRVAAPPGELQVCERTSRALGCAISMTVLHEDRSTGEAALDAAFGELRRVEQTMSLYLPESELSRLNRTGVLENADPYLVEVLKRSHDMGMRSGGAFDVTVQPLWDLYANARRAGTSPREEEILAASQKVNYRKVDIDGRTVRLREPGMAVTLNGIAQGFAADRAADALKRHGVTHALVNTGEMASIGRKQGNLPWTVGIQHPREPDAYVGLAKLAGRCMSTSGDYETAFTGDKRDHHIFEPRTGHSPSELSSVTVIAENATDADALSTAIFVLGAEKGVQLAGAFNADVLLIGKDGRQWATPSFPWASQAEAQG